MARASSPSTSDAIMEMDIDSSDDLSLLHNQAAPSSKGEEGSNMAVDLNSNESNDGTGTPTVSEIHGPQINMLPSYHLVRMTLRQLCDDADNERIILNAHYQRGDVWPSASQLEYLDTFLHSYYIPPLVFNVRTKDDYPLSYSNLPRVCLDGKQRILALKRFIDGEIPFKHYFNRSPSVISFGNDVSRNWWFKRLNDGTHADSSKLVIPANIRGQILQRHLVIVEYRGLREDLERDIFERSQRTKPLSQLEKLNARTPRFSAWIRKLHNAYFAETDSPSTASTTTPSLTLRERVWNHTKDRHYSIMAAIVANVEAVINGRTWSHLKSVDVANYLGRLTETDRRVQRMTISLMDRYVRLTVAMRPADIKDWDPSGQTYILTNPIFTTPNKLNTVEANCIPYLIYRFNDLTDAELLEAVEIFRNYMAASFEKNSPLKAPGAVALAVEYIDRLNWKVLQGKYEGVIIPDIYQPQGEAAVSESGNVSSTVQVGRRDSLLNGSSSSPALLTGSSTVVKEVKTNADTKSTASPSTNSLASPNTSTRPVSNSNQSANPKAPTQTANTANNKSNNGSKDNSSNASSSKQTQSKNSAKQANNAKNQQPAKNNTPKTSTQTNNTPANNKSGKKNAATAAKNNTPNNTARGSPANNSESSGKNPQAKGKQKETPVKETISVASSSTPATPQETVKQEHPQAEPLRQQPTQQQQQQKGKRSTHPLPEVPPFPRGVRVGTPLGVSTPPPNQSSNAETASASATVAMSSPSVNQSEAIRKAIMEKMKLEMARARSVEPTAVGNPDTAFSPNMSAPRTQPPVTYNIKTEPEITSSPAQSSLSADPEPDLAQQYLEKAIEELTKRSKSLGSAALANITQNQQNQQLQQLGQQQSPTQNENQEVELSLLPKPPPETVPMSRSSSAESAKIKANGQQASASTPKLQQQQQQPAQPPNQTPSTSTTANGQSKVVPSLGPSNTESNCNEATAQRAQLRHSSGVSYNGQKGSGVYPASGVYASEEIKEVASTPNTSKVVKTQYSSTTQSASAPTNTTSTVLPVTSNAETETNANLLLRIELPKNSDQEHSRSSVVMGSPEQHTSKPAAASASNASRPANTDFRSYVRSVKDEQRTLESRISDATHNSTPAHAPISQPQPPPSVHPSHIQAHQSTSAATPTPTRISVQGRANDAQEDTSLLKRIAPTDNETSKSEEEKDKGLRSRISEVSSSRNRAEHPDTPRKMDPPRTKSRADPPTLQDRFRNGSLPPPRGRNVPPRALQSRIARDSRSARDLSLSPRRRRRSDSWSSSSSTTSDRYYRRSVSPRSPRSARPRPPPRGGRAGRGKGRVEPDHPPRVRSHSEFMQDQQSRDKSSFAKRMRR